MSTHQKGFSLIELMIVLAVVAILAAIAYPSYQDQMNKSRRTDGQAFLLEMATLMEHYYTENNSYAGATVTNIGGGGTSREGYYAVTITNLSGSTWTLNAAPIGAQATDTCGTLTLTHTNIKGPTPDTCW